MKVFVTGSRGFIGKHLLLALKNRSIDVVPITFSNKAEEILTANGLIERRKKYVSPGDVLVHLSALGQRNQLNSDEEIYSHNFFKPRELLISMMNLGLKKVIITGSGAEYGETFMLRKPKPDDNLLPLDAYSRSKADLSVWISRYLQIPYSYFRLFQVYGSGATLPRLDATIENSFTSKKDIVLQFPKLKKDFISVCDVVELLVEEILESIPLGVVNVCSGIGSTVEDFTKKSLLGFSGLDKPRILHAENRMTLPENIIENYVGVPSNEIFRSGNFVSITKMAPQDLFKSLTYCRCGETIFRSY